MIWYNRPGPLISLKQNMIQPYKIVEYLSVLLVKYILEYYFIKKNKDDNIHKNKSASYHFSAGILSKTMENK